MISLLRLEFLPSRCHQMLCGLFLSSITMTDGDSAINAYGFPSGRNTYDSC